MLKTKFIVLFLLISSVTAVSQARPPARDYMYIKTYGINHGHGAEDQLYSFTVFLKNGENCKHTSWGTDEAGRFDKYFTSYSHRCTSGYERSFKNLNSVDKVVFEGNTNGVFIGNAVLASRRGGKGLKTLDFVYNRWVDDEADDRTLIRELYHVNDPRITKYSIRINTSMKKKAGTDSAIRIDLISADDESKSIYNAQLDNKNDNFEKGASEVFNLYQLTLGKINEICLSSDGTGENSGWYPEKIIVTDTKTNKSYIRKLNRWFRGGKYCFFVR